MHDAFTFHSAPPLLIINEVLLAGFLQLAKYIAKLEISPFLLILGDKPGFSACSRRGDIQLPIYGAEYILCYSASSAAPFLMALSLADLGRASAVVPLA